MKTVLDFRREITEETAQRVREFLLKRDAVHGSCLDAARYIARLLAVRTIGTFGVEGLLVFKEPDVSVTGYHIWLEMDGWIVDVTADQFNTSTTKFKPVLVGTYAENPTYQKRRLFSFVGRDFELMDFGNGEVVPVENFVFDRGGKTKDVREDDHAKQRRDDRDQLRGDDRSAAAQRDDHVPV